VAPLRQIEMRAFEKVQKAVKNRVAATEAPVASDRSSLSADRALATFPTRQP
jgi:hypothetical protein